jgi:hypothetical protein
MRIRNFLLTLLGALLPLSAFAQTGAADSVFAPFVSQLSVEARNNLARLSWIDSPDVRGPVFIFRAPQPFETGRIPANLRPLEVPYGTQSFIDETEGAGTVYYFVAASDGLGQRYDIVIPYNNTISVNINGSAAARVSPPEAQHLRPVESGLFGLEIRIEGEGVNITYRTASGQRNVVLYRSVQPLQNTADLLRAVIVYSGPPTPFTDYPAPGIPYYYAVIFEDELLQGTVGLIPGHNASLEPVETSPAGMAGLSDAETPIRAMPLPLVSVYNALPGSDWFSEAPAAVPLGPDAVKALEDIPRSNSGPPPKKRPRAFSRDLGAPSGGEESPLQVIVQGTFLKRDWQGALTELLNYLSLPRSPLSEARARFYLGQAYYFTGRNREALIEFLTVQPQYPQEARDWIDAVLTAMIY